jgi:hypothetical protein
VPVIGFLNGASLGGLLFYGTDYTPAAKASQFTVKTANRQGSDLIQPTINDLIEADLVIADLTEHNPNVMFELGVRMAEDKPVVLIKAHGTGPLFDVDNMLRVFAYSPNLWQTTRRKRHAQPSRLYQRRMGQPGVGEVVHEDPY